jgi:NTE family protein
LLFDGNNKTIVQNRYGNTPMRLLIIIILFHVSLSGVFAQEPDSTPENVKKTRPKIGLVLSGGGARGFAHIGVLKVLEENRIPVDFIAGASMGALVGSLYSTGRTPAQMEQLVETLDWEKLLSGGATYEELSYRRKQDRRNLPGSLSLKGRTVKSLKLPNSVNPGHEIGLAIDRIFFAYSKVDNFDDLPIPFRTVGTDMLNAETVVLKSGSLQQSLRATMAIPAVFAPVEIDGKILTDGGILNNIPTDVVKAMGADIILVVNIETQIGDRSALNNLIGVLRQTFMVATVENSRRSLRQADFIIAPDLKDYGSSSFTEGRAIIQLGYQGAKRKIALLKGLSLDEKEWRAHLETRRLRQIAETNPTTEFLAVEGADSSTEKQMVSEQLNEKYAGKPLDKSAVENDLTKLTGTKRFDSLGYESTRVDGKNGLLIRVYDTSERTERKTNLEVGLEVNNKDSDTTNFNLRGRLTVLDIGGHGSEWRNDFSIGSKTLIATEYFRPIGESGFFIAPNAHYSNRKLGFYEKGERLAEYSLETARIGIDLGYSINPESEIRFGYQIGVQNTERRIGDPLLPELRGRFSVASLGLKYDGADNAQIPTRGRRSSSSLKYYFDAPGTTSGFSQGEADFNAIYPISERYLVFGFGAVGTSFGKTVPSSQQFSVGGLYNVGGYGSEEFRASNFARGGLGFLRETYTLPTFFGGKLYFGGWYEGGSAFERFKNAHYRQSITTGVLTETPFGPIFVGGSFAEGGRRKLYFSLGHFF